MMMKSLYSKEDCVAALAEHGTQQKAADALGISRGMLIRTMRDKPERFKLLFLDIETAPNTSYTWGLFNQFISIDQIVSPGYTLCFTARWAHEEKASFFSIGKDGAFGMASAARDLLSQADAVCTYNGKKFDVPVLTRDFVMNRLTPPLPYFHVDLYQVVKRQFRFASNKLDFVCQQLGLGAKVQHKGMELWKKCIEGDAKSWKTMEKYNRHDVKLLSDLYDRLLPYITSHPNLGQWAKDEEPTCKNCGSHNVVRDGIIRLRVQMYQRWVCNDCGTSMRNRVRIGTPSKGLLV